MTYNSLAELFTAIANSIRGKTGGTEKIVANDFPAAIDGISAGGGDEWIGDGNTHIWIHLEEGRTSPVLGVCPDGTVTVDWGDGTEPDVLTGTSTTDVKVTPSHEYAKSGDYVISLTVDGEMGFSGYQSLSGGSYILRHSFDNASYQNLAYVSSVKKVEIGGGVKSIGNYAFCYCFSLRDISIPYGVTGIRNYAFYRCHSLPNINIPDSVTNFGTCAFGQCYTLSNISIPDSVTTIYSNVFSDCYGVKFYDFTDHSAVPTLGGTNAFNNIASDCEIRVPAALADEWKAATNWSTYADKIVGV